MEDRLVGDVPSRGLWFSRAGEAGSRPCQKRRGELGWLMVCGGEVKGDESFLATPACVRSVMLCRKRVDGPYLVHSMKARRISPDCHGTHLGKRFAGGHMTFVGRSTRRAFLDA